MKIADLVHKKDIRQHQTLLLFDKYGDRPVFVLKNPRSPIPFGHLFQLRVCHSSYMNQSLIRKHYFDVWKLMNLVILSTAFWLPFCRKTSQKMCFTYLWFHGFKNSHLLIKRTGTTKIAQKRQRLSFLCSFVHLNYCYPVVSRYLKLFLDGSRLSRNVSFRSERFNAVHPSFSCPACLKFIHSLTECLQILLYHSYIHKIHITAPESSVSCQIDYVICQTKTSGIQGKKFGVSWEPGGNCNARFAVLVQQGLTDQAHGVAIWLHPWECSIYNQTCSRLTSHH